ncbi:QDE2 protein [Amylocarpus encephaloides]|uniref:QDE2 protein n=1 Tax=Amylocarpus encephaloides TaxID=45428 RepID=A0A9P7YDG9_9HELO|nr:QDE2 protein [Amylocarpus encephaloides]
MAKSKGIGSLATTTLGNTFPARPGFGTQGKQIVVYANYFKVNVPANLAVTRYNIEVSPEAKGGKLARVFQLLFALPEFAGDIVSDMSSMVISRVPLNIPDGFVTEITYLGEGQEEPLPGAQVYNIKVITPLAVVISDFQAYLCAVNPGPSFDLRNEYLQVLNILFSHYPRIQEGTITTGKNRHFSNDRSPENANNIRILGGTLESLRGFYSSIRPATGGLILNVNVSHNVFLQPDRLSVIISQLGASNKANILKKLKLVKVNLLHLPPKVNKKTKEEIRRVKTIFNLAHPEDGRKEDHRPDIKVFGAGPKDVKFWISSPPQATGAEAPAKGKGKGKGKGKTPGPALPDNTYISVFDYFKARYPNFTLNPAFPVVNVGNREKPNYLPAEVCVVVPGQMIKRRLSPDQTQEMIKFACRKPWENANSIIGDGKSVLGLNNTAVRFGLAVGQSLLTINARVLAAPAVKYKNFSNKDTSVAPRFGSWNMADIKFHTGSNLGPWTYIVFNHSRTGSYEIQHVRPTVMNFQRFLIKSGINASELITEPQPPKIDLVEETATNDDTIRRIFRAMCITKDKPRPKFVLCILPFNDVAIYNAIKTVADTKAGIHTVCCVVQKIMKEQRQDQYFGNVSLKFNLKAGGINQTLEPSKLGIISEGKTMIVGCDVTHPSPGSKENAPSVAGIVASVDKFLGQWPSDFRIQESRKEMITGLEGMFFSRLTLWESRNRTLPENIIVYRDGVSEGQYQQILDDELPQLRKACQQKYTALATKQGIPRISIIVCGKRHHTRFYPSTVENADRSSNCEPGTVVDRGVTEVRFWDFFIQSHACLQGTARPGHYYVILDEVFRRARSKAPHQNAADALEELTHNMCHLFGRATKAVSLCPPAYYADLLCTRLRCYLSEQFDPSDTSVTPSVTSGTTGAKDSIPEIIIPESLRDSMYYI